MDGLQPRRRDDGDQGRGPADPRGRDAEDPPAPVPRGQLLRRHDRRHARATGRSTTATRSRSPRPPTRSSSTSILTSLQADTPQGPPEPARGLRHRPRCTSRRRPRTSARTRTCEGESAGAGAERLARRTRPAPASRTPRGSRRRSWGRSRSDLRKLIAGLQKTARRARAATRSSSRTSSPTSTARWRRSPSEQGNLRAGRRPARADDREGPRATSATSPTRCRRRGRSCATFIPGVRETPATIAAAGPWLDAVHRARLEAELGGLLKDLQPDDGELRQGRGRVDRLQQADGPDQPLLLERDPAGRRRRAPGRRRHHRRADLQGVLVLGRRLRRRGARTSTATAPTRAFRPVAARTSSRATKLPGTAARSTTSCSATRSLPPLGTRPTHPDKKPPYKPNVACYKNKPPDLNGPAAAAGPPDATGNAMARAIQKHLRDFIAIIVLVVLALLVGAYILSNQRFYLPGWVPVVGSRLLRAQGRVPDGPVGDAGPGPDRRHRRRAGRRRQERRAQGRPRDHHDDRQEEVRGR